MHFRISTHPRVTVLVTLIATVKKETPPTTAGPGTRVPAGPAQDIKIRLHIVNGLRSASKKVHTT